MKTKSGYVAIIGKPNVGKSTLMNSILGERLSIITNKPQTTRKRVLGILSNDDYQIIFLDTPGILDPNYLLQRKLLDYINNSVKDADVIIIMVDIIKDAQGNRTLNDKRILQILERNEKPKIILINKIDQSDETVVNAIIGKLEATNYFERIIPISAIKGFGTEAVLSSIIEHLPEGPKYFPDDQITDEPERFFVSEIIREKIFENYKEEIPFSTEVVIEEFVERESSKDFVSASIIVERETQKPIIIGKRGEAIKRIGKIARESIENFLQREVFLELRVKVKPKWRNDKNMLRSFGYDSENE